MKYGDKWSARLGTELNKYIMEQQQRTTPARPNAPTGSNKLYYLTRQHYRPIITEVGSNWNQVFASCFRPESKDSVDQTLRLIFTFGDKDKHNYPNNFFQENSDKLLAALSSAGRLNSAINEAYPTLLNPAGILIEGGDDGRTDVFFSSLEGRDRSNLTPVRITKERGNLVAKKLGDLLKRGPFVLDLADSARVTYLLDAVSYREALGVIATAVKRDRVEIHGAIGSVVSLDPKRVE